MKQMNDKKDEFDLAARIDYGVKLGVKEAILEHKREGRSIFISENGKIIEIPPEEI